MIEDGPAAFCAATTPNAASPNVTKAAMTATTTRIASSTVLSLLKVKAQSRGESMKTAVERLRNPLCGFHDQ
jgi:hypothetical protein